MKHLIGILLIALAFNASAGSQTGTLDYVIVRASDGLVYFTLKDGALNNRPDCATIAYWMIKDENSNAGKQQYSMILAAHAAGKTVSVTGMNTCSRWGDGEDVNTIQIKNP
mgnify:CR=1 FL=1